MSYNKKGLLVFIFGVLAVAATVAGVFAFRSFMAKADALSTPKGIKSLRVSPTAAEITFNTESEAVASIECAAVKNGPFSLCGSESSLTRNHRLKTSIILDPEKEYYFNIKIGRKTYDELGLPFVISKEVNKESNASETFPPSLLGVCQGDSLFNAIYDLNKDGCIRQNDWDMFGR